MSDDRSYIKIFRKMLNWGWYGDTNTFRVFMHILLRANYKDSEYMGHVIHAGECVFGYNSWAKQLGLSVRQVRTAIEHLKSTNEVTIKTTNKFSIVTVVKWEFWQVEDGQPTIKTTSDATSKRQANDKQTTTSKEYKNINTTTTIKRPTLEDVKAYVRDNDLIIDAEYFYKYYETARWTDNKGKQIKNWKLKALNWNKREATNVRDNARTGSSQFSGLRVANGNRIQQAETVETGFLRVASDFSQNE